MKRFLPAALFLAATQVLAHPGHGKPGFIHDHALADLALILFGILVVGIAGWALLRLLWRKPR
jgi:hypothetical protein